MRFVDRLKRQREIERSPYRHPTDIEIDEANLVKVLVNNAEEIENAVRALEWITHLAHGISKDGTCHVTDAEWRDAADVGREALGALKGDLHLNEGGD